MKDGLVVASIATAILAASPILIAATGELLAEVTGVYNIGIEGSLLIGALAAVIATGETGSVTVGLLAAIALGAASSFVFALAVVVLRADMVVAGLALVFIGLGGTGVVGADYVRTSPGGTLPTWEIPLLSDIPHVGTALFEHLSLTYVAFLLPILAWFLLYRTRHGLNMRAIGENPATADVAGINVNFWRVFYTSVGGAAAGLGGGFITLGVVETWLPNVSAGQGWIALAIVIFASWQPLPLIVGALLFGALGTLGNVAQAEGWAVPTPFFTALPYAGTLIVVAAVAWFRGARGERQPWPAALGNPFFRGG